MAKTKKNKWNNLPTHAREDADLKNREMLRTRVGKWRDRLEEEEANATTYSEDAYVGYPLGTVINMRSGHYYVRMDDNGETIDLNVKGSLKDGVRNTTTVAAPGDRVHVERYTDGGGLIVAVVPRTSVLSRPDPFRRHLQDIMVANVEQLVIVSSVSGPAFWHELVDRYLVYAEYYELEPLLVINKIDEATEEQLAPIVELYEERLGYRVIATSSITGQGVDELRQLIGTKLNVVTGLSGVGKSSVLNAVQPGLNLRVGEVSDFFSNDGQHTTTTTTLYPLDDGGYVADTPGIRGFGLWDIEPAELDYYFRDFRPFISQCKFNDCNHHDEPKCAVRQAVEDGEIDQIRYNSFLKLYEETNPALERHY